MGELALIIVIFLCGLLAMFIELFIPGAVVGMIGLLAVAASIVYAVMAGYPTTAVVLLLAALAFVPVFFILWKSVATKFLVSKGGEEGFRPSTTIDQELVGLEGPSVTPLRPSGIAHLNGRRYDVVTRGEMLQKGARVRVIEVSGNRVVVKEA